MKPRIHHALAALFLATAAPVAFSQATAPAGLVAEPVASVSRADDVANAVAQALNAEASLKSSKITVQPDEGNVLLTGSTLTEAQRIKATEIARAHAGAGQVINTLAPDELVIAAPPIATLAVADEPEGEAAPQPTTEEKS